MLLCDVAPDVPRQHAAHDHCPGWPGEGVQPTSEQLLAWIRGAADHEVIPFLDRLRSAAEDGQMAFIGNWRQRAEVFDETNRDITLITTWIDTSYPEDISDELRMRRRVDKVMEESGEVIDALNGYWGENPRKGRTNDLDKVEYELLDVAAAALGAHISVSGDMAPLRSLNEHVSQVADRMRAAQAEAEA